MPSSAKHPESLGRSRPAKRVNRPESVVLTTAFEPFGGDTVNASELAVRTLEGRVIAGRRVATAILPCVFGAAPSALLDLMRKHRPELVLCVGEAGGRSEISLERVAINVDDARLPDNAGARLTDQPIVPGAPAAYWSTLPIKSLVAALRAQGLPASVSDSAGTFVCNHVFYRLMHALRRRPGVRGGFVHVPLAPDQAARRPGNPPSLETARVALALEEIVSVSLERDASDRT